MKLLCTIFLSILFYLSANCQQVGVFGAYVNNHFYDLQGKYPDYNSNYESGDGYSFGIGIEKLKVKSESDTFRLKLGLKLTRYSGHIGVSTSGPTGGGSLSYQADKYVIGFVFCPLNTNIYKELVFSAGVEINFLIASKDLVYQSGYVVNSSNTSSSFTITQSENAVSQNPINLGLNLNLSYNIKIGKQIYLVPNYGFYFGITPEFKQLQTKTKSYRHNFSLGIAKRF